MATLLGTCITKMEHRGRVYKARAELDSGSGLSFVTSQLVNKLGLKRTEEHIRIKAFQRSDTPPIKYSVELTFKVPLGSVTVHRTIKALVVETITGDLPLGPLPEVRSNPCLHDLKLADPGFDRPGRVDVLFGVDFFPTLLRGSTVFSEDKLICATDTAYSWVVTGRCLGALVPLLAGHASSTSVHDGSHT